MKMLSKTFGVRSSAMRSLIMALVLSTSSTAVARAESYAVISDLDDTIKVTHSNAKDPWETVIRSLFRREAFSGMPALLQGFKQHAAPAMSRPEEPSLFVVSGTTTAARFAVQDFINLQDLDDQRTEVTLSTNPLQTVLAYKTQGFEQIAAAHPGLKFVLLGDDTSFDSEAYLAFRAAHPEKVLAIYIHRINADATADHLQWIASQGIHIFTTAYEVGAQEVLAGRLTVAELAPVFQHIEAPTPNELLIPDWSYQDEDFAAREATCAQLAALSVDAEHECTQVLATTQTALAENAQINSGTAVRMLQFDKSLEPWVGTQAK